MALRDRRGPLTALVLAVAYLLLLTDTVLIVARGLGWEGRVVVSAPLQIMLGMAAAGFIWRTCLRFAFTAQEYGLREGVMAVLRIPIGNIIAIMAGRRALAAYLRSLRGEAVRWDKTVHLDHPAKPPVEGLRA